MSRARTVTIKDVDNGEDKTFTLRYRNGKDVALDKTIEDFYKSQFSTVISNLNTIQTQYNSISRDVLPILRSISAEFKKLNAVYNPSIAVINTLDEANASVAEWNKVYKTAAFPVLTNLLTRITTLGKKANSLRKKQKQEQLYEIPQIDIMSIKVQIDNINLLFQTLNDNVTNTNETKEYHDSTLNCINTLNENFKNLEEAINNTELALAKIPGMINNYSNSEKNIVSYYNQLVKSKKSGQPNAGAGAGESKENIIQPPSPTVIKSGSDSKEDSPINSRNRNSSDEKNDSPGLKPMPSRVQMIAALSQQGIFNNDNKSLSQPSLPNPIYVAKSNMSSANSQHALLGSNSQAIQQQKQAALLQKQSASNLAAARLPNRQ